MEWILRDHTGVTLLQISSHRQFVASATVAGSGIAGNEGLSLYILLIQRVIKT